MNETTQPAAWAVTAHGRAQKLVMRVDVADELVCKWRESDLDATAVPLFTWDAVEAERERCAQIVEWGFNAAAGNLSDEQVAALTIMLDRCKDDPRTACLLPLVCGPNVAGNRLARQGQSELTGLLGPGSEA